MLPRPSRIPSRRQTHAQPAFTLLELMLALLCMSLSAYLALAGLNKIRHQIQRDAFIAELRLIGQSFSDHYKAQGKWPAPTNGQSVIPPGMEAVLAKTHWLTGLPFGGGYEWRPPFEKDNAEVLTDNELPRAGVITVTAFAPFRQIELTPADLLFIDTKLDDGNLATGRFRTGFNGWINYEVPGEAASR